MKEFLNYVDISWGGSAKLCTTLQYTPHKAKVFTIGGVKNTQKSNHEIYGWTLLAINVVIDTIFFLSHIAPLKISAHVYFWHGRCQCLFVVCK